MEEWNETLMSSVSGNTKTSASMDMAAIESCIGSITLLYDYHSSNQNLDEEFDRLVD